MPEEHMTETDLERVLDHLEDYNLNSRNYQTLQSTLDSIDNISVSLAEKLLKLCVRDKIEDLKYTTHIINIISSLLKKIKEGDCSPLPNLVPSALAVLNILKTTALFSKVEALKILCFDLIISYPNETLTTLTVNHPEEIYELINLYCHQLIPPEIRIQPINIVEKLLRILPPDKRAIFVKDGIGIWFSKIIPVVVEHLMTSNNIVPHAMDTIEMLTETLVIYDYTNYPEWLQIMEHIQTSKKYPAMMKALLNKGCDYWHRLWMMFVKLLKHQITKWSNSNASPINSILPCVEQAFKMDITNRCRAFKCWNVLIDSFAKETNETFLIRRLKLLIVPLTTNIAKVEETALAKLDTWCHLIYRFQAKLDRFMETVVMQLLYFSFGKPSGTSFVPGMMSQKTKVQCVKVFINLIGHVECDGCVTLPKLEVNLCHTKLFVNHWKDWFHSLNSAIRICVEYHDDFLDTQIKCVWKSFIIMISDLPENNIRRDLFNQALVLLEELTKENDNRLLGVTINILIPTLFERNVKIDTLLKSKNDQYVPVQKVFSLLNSLPLDSLDDGTIATEGIKSVTNYVVGDAVTTSDITEMLVNILSENSLLLWSAMVESVCPYTSSLCPLMQCKLLLWPFSTMKNFAKNEHAKTAWINMYNVAIPYLQTTSIHKEIIEKLNIHSNDESSYFFALSATITLLEQKLKDKDSCLDGEIKLIVQLSSKINSSQIILILPSLTDIIIHLLDSLHKNINIIMAENIMLIVNNLLKICNVLFKEEPNNVHYIIKHIENIFDSLESILKLDKYSELKLHLLDQQLEDSAEYLTHQNSFIRYILANHKISYNKNISEQVGKETSTEKHSVNTKTINKLPNEFSANTEISKKSKKEVSIINTVVEDGEEFVVVKSNWRFNPRKLTDNQKEKLQRKREDIPALYQDLSQSQDEFKLVTFKADSQDTSNTLSKSSNLPANENVSILKNMPNSEYVPKIINNLIIKETKDLNPTTCEVKLNDISDKFENDDKTKHFQSTGKCIKSPRMALKDRVFRNVRNLMEKSNIAHECKDLRSNKPDFAVKIPTEEKYFNAHSQNNLERPTRIKRKPKKFDDVELFALKKRRQSLNSNESPTNKASTENQRDVNTVTEPLKQTIVTEDKEKADTVNKDELNVALKEISPLPKDTGNKEINILKNSENESISEEKVYVAYVAGLEITHNSVKNNKCLIEQLIQKPNLDLTEINVSDDELLIGYEKINDNSGFDKNKSNPESFPLLIKSNINTNSDESTNNVSEFIEKKSVDDTQNLFISHTEVNKKPEKPYFGIENEAISEEKQLKCDFNKNDTITTPITTDNKETTETQTCSNVAEYSIVPAVPTTDRINKKNNDNFGSDNIAVSTPNRKELNGQKSTNKFKTKKSRIENQLAIDMVEGHPYLNVQSEKRLTRKSKLGSPKRRKTLTPNAARNKLPTKCLFKHNKIREKKKSISVTDSLVDENTLASQDVIESSQDSTVTTISIKPSKLLVKEARVILECFNDNLVTQNLVDKSANEIGLTNMESNNDTYNNTNVNNLTDVMDTEPIIDRSFNKTSVSDLTEDMDTEPIDDRSNTVVGEDNSPIVVSSDETLVQNTADADTQIIDPDMLSEQNISYEVLEMDKTRIEDEKKIKTLENNCLTIKNDDIKKYISNNDALSLSISTAEDITAMSDSLLLSDSKQDISSPSDNEQRKKDFLNNTLEISPIKTLSPVRNQKSPETSSDYVVIKLTSPVQCNGEPFDKSDSPEIFTEDKLSPDKRDQSPPRDEIIVMNTSPSSSLSLKKNRPQVRTGGRAAQMLGLCVSNRLQSKISSEKSIEDDAKTKTLVNTSARRNLRVLYSNVENNDNSDETEESENFLKFKRIIPATDCSPSGPILKRKLIDITDDTTVSPASKRKRVSFHDPPVSTTICVKKYIEPISIRSPQNSAVKRLERQTRAQIATKSPRRLDNVFKLDSILNKAVESFSERNDTNTNETEMSSLDETPVVEVVKTSDLNDADPICEGLLDCKDHISNIAEDLSSPTMKVLLVKSLEGNVETIGDLAKMTELEVNRLSIKAPKVQVVKKVLNDYLAKVKKACEEITPTVEAAMSESTVIEAYTSVKVQTDSKLVQSVDIQTESVAVSSNSSQTESVLSANTSVQTEESGSKSTAEIIATCISERPDFLESLCGNLDEPSKQRITESLPLNNITTMLMNRLKSDDFNDFLINVLDESKLRTEDDNECKVLSILQDHLTERYESKKLILFCSNLLKKIYKKSA